MQIKDLDGVAHQWHLTGNMAHGKTINKSSLHLAARQILTNIFPTMQLLETEDNTAGIEEISCAGGACII